MPLIRVLVISLFMLSGHVSAGEASAPAPPTLTTDSATATAGYYTLSWDAAADAAPGFELQEARGADFAQPRSVYQGPDQARSFSGRADGIYHYRVRSTQPDAPWSAPVQVEVAHHSLARAGLFFALGALVFVATLILILSAPKENSGP